MISDSVGEWIQAACASWWNSISKRDGVTVCRADVAGGNPLTQRFSATTVDHVEQPRDPTAVRSTTPVTKLVEW